jgi:quercetin dioxygenase-like cupin family protein
MEDNVVPIRTVAAAILVVIVLAFLAGYAVAQRQPPAQNVGQTEELLRSLDLSNELESTKGRTLRMRKVTLAPGGVLGLHNHVDRPAITYLLQGEVTYHQDGKPDQSVKPGGGFAEGRATTHWAENTGKTPAVWVAVDIPKP